MKIIHNNWRHFLNVLFFPSAFFFFYPERKPAATREVISCTASSQNVFDSSLEAITINDNQQSAGEFRNGIYYINLEVREGYWWPESKKGNPIKIKAFAEAGKPLQVPGPLVRVPAGATVQLSVRNDIKGAVKVYGFTSRLYRPDNRKDSIVIQEGEIKTINFNAGAPGTFLYTAKDRADTLTPSVVATPFFNSQLYGALIVDPFNEPIQPKERIFIIGVCGAGNSADAVQTKYVINGLSWPYTERLQYTVGEKVDWRVINASVLGHPMHLHGFPFVISSFVFPSAAKDSVIPEEKRKPIVTQNLIPMNRMRISWVPEKTGNWLFHCHLLDHTLPANFVAGKDHADHIRMTTETHASSGMGGLILGIQVQTGKEHKDAELIKSVPERKLTLLVGEQPQNYSNNPSGKGFLLVEDGNLSPNKYSIPGPTIILKKDQPVAIKIINHLKEPTTIHWHGLLVDSYFDGVAGWGNQGKKLAPLMQPNDSFTVHLTPTQAGTFMYHTHMHDRQIFEGLYGAMVVLKPGEMYDPGIDKILLISQGGNNITYTGSWINGFTNLHYLLNGNQHPPPMHFQKGITYHIRLIHISSQNNSYFISPRSGFEVSLKQDSTPVQWTLIGKDGYLFPETQYETLRAGNQRAAPGTTHDIAFTPPKTGVYRFEARMDEQTVITQLIEVEQ